MTNFNAPLRAPIDVIADALHVWTGASDRRWRRHQRKAERLAEVAIAALLDEGYCIAPEETKR